MSFEETIGISSSTSIDGDEALGIARRWLKIFCPSRKNFKRTSPETQLLWDSISGNVYGEKAVEEYEKEQALQYYIFDDSFEPERPKILITEQKPAYGVYLMDFHVFPKNMAWCMSFTHEDGWIGPIYTRNPDYTLLNKKNIQAIEARKRGYA